MSLTSEKSLETQLAELGRSMNAARVHAGLSVEALSTATGVSVATLWRIEQGNGGVGIRNLMAVMHHLGLSIEQYPRVMDQRALPIHARFVDDPTVVDAVEEAVTELCEKLDELFPGASREREGISSNFQGHLQDHVFAMLCGQMHAQKSHRVALPELLYSERMLGREYSLADNPVYAPNEPTAVGFLVRLVGTDQVLEDGRFLPARKVHDMYTSWDAAANAVREYVRRTGEHLPGPVRIVKGWWGEGETGVHFGPPVVEDDNAPL
jgi:transcriptional regulator with XRE-family HTH domain